MDVAALVEKIWRRFVVAENDNGVEADAEGEDRAVLLGPLRVGAPGFFLGELVNIADQREASGAPAVVVVGCYDGEEEDGDEVEHLRVLGLRYCPQRNE